MDYLGLFSPLNEPWQWAYFIEVEGLESWEAISDEIFSRNGDRVDDITQSTTRFYGRTNYNPKPRGQHPLRLMNVELDVWEGVNVGVNEYYDIHDKIFDGKDDVWYMGQYSPANENYHWAYFYWFDSWELLNEMSIASFRTTGHPEMLKTICTRNYR
jgi:hypothetical protein